MSAKSFAHSVYKSLIKSNFHPFTRGDIILVKRHHSLLSSLISAKAKADSGACNATHAERYIGNGLAISSDLTVNIHPINSFFEGKHDVHVFSNSDYFKAQRNALVALSIVHHGKFYDFLGISGQCVSFLTRLRIFEKFLNSTNYFICSEFVINIEKKVSDQSLCGLASDSQVPTPDDLFDFLSSRTNLGWHQVFNLVI